jgi:hypothetical protein
MNPGDLAWTSRQPWHRLLAPLPADVAPRRKPVAPPEILRTPAAAAIAGWQQLVLELSAGAAGLRVVLVLLDETGRAISASDAVLYGAQSAGTAAPVNPAPPTQMLQETIGGRFEPDGTFRGTYWRTGGPEPTDDQDPQWESTPREPTGAEVAALRALVADLLRREPVSE